MRCFVEAGGRLNYGLLLFFGLPSVVCGCLLVVDHPPIANRHQPPTANRQQPLPANLHPPPAATSHQPPVCCLLLWLLLLLLLLLQPVNECHRPLVSNCSLSLRMQHQQPLLSLMHFG